MGAVLAVGCTHGPHVGMTDETMADVYFRRNLADPRTPERWKDRANWPAPMREEWADDEGAAAANRHRTTLLDGFRAARAAIDEFAPDFVLIWGDDQYENFKEDLLPPFCVFGLDQLVCAGGMRLPNIWNEGPDHERLITGHREAANYLVRELIAEGFDIPSAWGLLHAKRLGHAFLRTVDYLDADRVGFPYPIIPFHVNCYGSDLRIPGSGERTEVGRLQEHMPNVPPPSPSPWRCFDIGKAVRRIVEESPWRVVLIGSSSWSHASLTKKNDYMYPDVQEDRSRYEELCEGRQRLWRDLDPQQIRESGQNELLNWVCLAGATEGQVPEVLAYSETYIFNSSKAVMLFQ